MISEADRIAARGVPITVGEESLRVRFSMASLLFLEKEYGGLDVFWAKLGEKGFGTTRVETIANGLVAGLLHTVPDDQEIEDFKRDLLKQLSPDLLTHLETVMEAFIQSIPAMEASGPKVKGSRANSRGGASTSSRPSAMAAATRSSGK